jgi:hypothetical protein
MKAEQPYNTNGSRSSIAINPSENLQGRSLRMTLALKHGITDHLWNCRGTAGYALCASN